jgi:alpha-D-xyloside xylohydrolase
MVGDRMMVAPIFAGEAARKIVLPDGAWHDFWTGEALQGGTELTVSASTEKIPVYVKGGSIIPWADIGLFAGAPETRSLTVRVYGDGSLPFALQSGRDRLLLDWNNGQRGVKGQFAGYNVHAWKRMG